MALYKRDKNAFFKNFIFWPCSVACRISGPGPGLELVLTTGELTVAQTTNSLLQDEHLN